MLNLLLQAKNPKIVPCKPSACDKAWNNW